MDIESKIWTWTNVGTKKHAFVDGVALCRKNITRNPESVALHGMDYCTAKGASICTGCDRKFNAAIEREEAYQARLAASMQPSTGEGDYLPPADGYTSFPDTENPAPSTKTADAPCCEHASMYHGAKGCDECSCTTARADMTAHQGTVTDTTTEDNDMTNPRPITGPLTRRQTQVMDLLLDDRRQTEVATTLGVSAPYVSEEAQIASRKLKARTTNGGVANYATAKAYIQAAELIEGHRFTEPDKELNGAIVDAVLSGIANILRERAGRLLPQ